MNNLYNNLVSQYGSVNVKPTNNGTYEVSYSGTKIIVPQNLSKDAYVVSYTPGYGDSSTNRSLISQYFSNNNMDNAILVIASSTDATNSSEIGYNTLQSLGCNTEGVITTGFSYSAPSSIIEAANFSKKHTNIPTTCISIDGTSSEHHLYYSNSTSDAYAGINPTGTGSNFTIITVDGQFDHLSQTAKFANSGITSYNLSTKAEVYTDNIANCHDGASIDVMQFIVPYILGKKDSVNSAKGYFLRDASGKTVNMSFLRTNLNDSSSNNNSSNSSNSIKLVSISNKKETSTENIYQSAFSKHSELANLSELKLLNMNESSSSYISSDFQYVCSSMNSIRSIIKNSDSYASIKQMSSQVSGGIFSIISSYINYYMDVVSNLYNKLSLETEAIVSYAQYIVDIDNSLKNKGAETIDSNSIKSVKTISLSNNGGQYSYRENTTNNTISNDNSQYSDKENDIENSTNNVIEYVYDDNHKMLVEMDGEKIVKITHQYKLTNPLEYKEFVEKIYASFEDPDIIESISLNGNIVNVVLKDNYCATLTLNNIKSITKEV